MVGLSPPMSTRTWELESCATHGKTSAAQTSDRSGSIAIFERHRQRTSRSVCSPASATARARVWIPRLL